MVKTVGNIKHHFLKNESESPYLMVCSICSENKEGKEENEYQLKIPLDAQTWVKYKDKIEATISEFELKHLNCKVK